MKKATEAMDYEDDEVDFKELLTPKPSVKKTVKNLRRDKREQRKLADLSVMGLVWYVLFWRLFVPNHAVIAWTALFATNTLWIVKVLH